MGLYKAESDFESVLAETEAKASAVMGASPPSSVEELFEAKKVYAQTVFDCAFEERLKIATTPAQVEDAVAVMEDWLQSRLSEFVDLVLLGQEKQAPDFLQEEIAKQVLELKVWVGSRFCYWKGEAYRRIREMKKAEAESAEVTESPKEMRARERWAVVEPKLTEMGLTRERWAIESGLDYNTVRDYLNAETVTLRPGTRKALAATLGLAPEALPK